MSIKYKKMNITSDCVPSKISYAITNAYEKEIIILYTRIWYLLLFEVIV